jgi:NADH-quinone oxidoreductase subunit G
MSGILKIQKEDLILVSIMPCMSKKSELSKNDIVDIDYVLMTQELTRMIEESGLIFGEFEPLF